MAASRQRESDMKGAPIGTAIDIAGHVFGELTAIKPMPRPESGWGGGEVRWLCKCSCGKTHSAHARVLRLGNVKSCGCKKNASRVNGPLIDLTGRRFGRLVVLHQEPVEGSGKRMWRCRCDCGGESAPRGTDLMAGNTKSCGCLKRKVTLREAPVEPSRSRSGAGRAR